MSTRTVSSSRKPIYPYGSTSSIYTGIASTSKIAVTSVAAQNNLTAMSFSAWINVFGPSGGNAGRIFHKGGGGIGYFDIYHQSSNKTLVFSSDWATDEVANIANGSIQYGIWYHVVVTYSGVVGAAPIIYINGASVTVTPTSTSVGARGSDNTNLTIGANSVVASRNFNGFISHAQLYNKVLSPSEITALYSTGVTATGLVGNWKLDEGSGSTATDSTGNADGTETNCSYTTDVPITIRSSAINRYLLPTGSQYSIKGDGSTTKISLTQGNGLPLCANTAFSILGWIKVTDSSLVNTIFCEGSSGGTSPVILLDVISTTPGTVRYLVRNDAATALVNSVNTVKRLSKGIWYHVALVDNNGSWRIYIDGVVDLNNSAGGSDYTRTGSFTFNKTTLLKLSRSDESGPSKAFHKDIMLFSRALSPTEVLNASRNIPISKTGLVRRYKFNEGSGTTATDSSVNADDVSMTGTTYSTDFKLQPRSSV